MSSQLAMSAFQNHVRDSSSQLGYRVRIPTQELDKAEKWSSVPRDAGHEDKSFSVKAVLQTGSPRLPSGSHYSRSRSSCTRLRQICMLYCALSCVLFFMSLCTRYYDKSPVDIIVTTNAIDPFVIRAATENADITACIWATDHDIGSIFAWAARWSGPISLLMVTTVEPASEEHENLLRKLSAQQNRSTLLNGTLTLHLAHLSPQTPDNPNAFLNLARLFSQTPRVALFPANLSTLPPKSLYKSLVSHSTVSSAAILEPTRPKHRPIILTARGQTGFPFSPMAPLVMGRDDPLWCTERFFPPTTREEDWEKCLWQVWLENFGDVEVRQTRGWFHDMISMPTSDPFVASGLRHRLVAKYRSETCVLATRQLAALRSTDKELDAKKARWLKRVCRAWTNAAQSPA
ncbi:hypothetical protein WOLCODRAFT_144554 [Wolfiporia cocos MD-104 SS10]|uniref:Uncharacterized protein n=1 Tax=Wolfiporia cocos (strain MD-104) TaxID=742152 RepID=A0A2H3K532_WOLCO|nr:hypothetical protein WOLCODRAFT_144554 [Wolfiporia cocos MD-104 SS10]